MKLLSLNGLETLKRAKQAERDERILDDRKAIALARRDAWERKATLRDLAQALLTAQQAEARSGYVAAKCRAVSNA